MDLKVLKLDSQGDDVAAWQYFLIGVGLYSGVASGVFDTKTRDATILFQRKYGLGADGAVGKFTYAKAESLGFCPTPHDGEIDKHSPDWPPKPDFSPLVTNEQLASIFGRFSYRPAVSSDPEAIIITDNWYRDNIVRINIPQLAKIKNANGGKNLPFHKLVADKIITLFEAWEKEGLISLIIDFGGSYVPRFVRGSKTTLSNHAFGSAFDINVQWNYLGSRPALVGSVGSVRELVPIANDLGIYWGGHFGMASTGVNGAGMSGPRSDGMHFSVAKL
jgi:peptidoglycan hydrolase-like protein with peptidoglycan-binding domain